jgi:putative FmdB family regulatory protein
LEGDLPIYAYGCKECGHQFEEIQKITEDPITLCPKCEKDAVRRMVSAPSFHLKGDGWYKDHYGLKPSGGSSDSGSSGGD